MITGFDAAVRGMTVGDSRTVRLGPAEAYGERRDDLIIELPIGQLPAGIGKGDSVQFTNGATGCHSGGDRRSVSGGRKPQARRAGADL